MTSANFRSYPIAEITLDRETRQRKKLTGIDELAESIARLGLINPIVITNDGILIAGERRLTACKQLGWDNIAVQFTDDLSEYELQCIEFEENVKRSDLTWQEEVEAIARLHKLKLANEPDWSMEDTGDLLGGLSAPTISRKLQVAAAMDRPEVANAERFSTALNIVARDEERKRSTAMEAVAARINQGPIMQSVKDGSWRKKYDTISEKEVAEFEGKPLPVPLLHANFHEWQESYDGPKFNLIHCDFPYGINVADAPRMSAGIVDHYDDSPDVFFSLLARLGHAMENVVAESANLIFWFSPKFYCQAKEALTRMGWKVADYPLIWFKSDGAGVAPDPQRGPRNVYEMAFFATRGDRKLTAAGTKNNVFAFPGRRNWVNEKGEKEIAIHASEKPYPMLRHFMQMVCDDYSFVLDPTCGSGNALKVAEDLGASKALGLEQSKEFFDIAVNNWTKR